MFPIKEPAVVWTAAATRSFIEMYESHPCLYDLTNQDYHNREKRRHALLEIAEALHTTADEVSKKIRSIRAQYSREKKLQRSREANGRMSRKWCFLDQLAFLDGFITSKEDLVSMAQNSNNMFAQHYNAFPDAVDVRSMESDGSEQGGLGASGMSLTMGSDDTGRTTGADADQNQDKGDERVSMVVPNEEDIKQDIAMTTSHSAFGKSSDSLQSPPSHRASVIGQLNPPGRASGTVSPNLHRRSFVIAGNRGRKPVQAAHNAGPYRRNIRSSAPTANPSSFPIYGQTVPSFTDEDEEAVFGKLISIELRSLTNNAVKQLAKFRIQNIIYEAHMGLLRPLITTTMPMFPQPIPQHEGMQAGHESSDSETGSNGNAHLARFNDDVGQRATQVGNLGNASVHI